VTWLVVGRFLRAVPGWLYAVLAFVLTALMAFAQYQRAGHFKRKAKREASKARTVERIMDADNEAEKRAEERADEIEKLGDAYSTRRSEYWNRLRNRQSLH